MTSVRVSVRDVVHYKVGLDSLPQLHRRRFERIVQCSPSFGSFFSQGAFRPRSHGIRSTVPSSESDFAIPQ